MNDRGISGSPEGLTTLTLAVLDVNERPTVALTNVVTSLDENQTLVTSRRVADISVTDDALGQESMTLVGSLSNAFEIIENELHLRAGTVLDFESVQQLVVDVHIDDTEIPGSPDGIATLTLIVTNLNDPPTIAVEAVVSRVAETKSLPSRLKIANLTINDDSLGAESVSIDGASSDLFEIVGNNELYLRAFSLLNFESQPETIVLVGVDDLEIPGAPDSVSTLTLSVTDVNDPPSTVNLSNRTVAENLSGATIGTLSGFDEDDNQDLSFHTDDKRFEIKGTTLKLRNGIAVNSADPVTVEIIATDTGTPPESSTHPLTLLVMPNPRAWQYAPQPVDANGDGNVVPQDALRLINQLNQPTILDATGRLPLARPADSVLPYYDINGDGFCTPTDALVIINFLNRPAAEGEFIWIPDSRSSTSSPSVEEVEPVESADFEHPTEPWLWGSAIEEEASLAPSGSARNSAELFDWDTINLLLDELSDEWLQSIHRPPDTEQ